MPVTTVPSQVQQNSEAVFEQVLQNKDAITDDYSAPCVAIVLCERSLPSQQEVLSQRLKQASAAVAQRTTHLTESEIDDLIEEARTESQSEVVTQ